MAPQALRLELDFLNIAMIPLNPSLRLTRLIVFKGGKTAYDESFHTGVGLTPK